MKNVSELKGYMNFHNRGRVLFEKKLASLLNCNVNIQIHKIEDFERGMGLDITSNALRNCYDWGDRKDEVIIVPKVFDYDSGEAVALLPIRLSGPEVHAIPKRYLDRITRTISIQLTQCATHKFKNSMDLFGNEFEENIITSCLCGKGKDTAQIKFLLSLITRLSRTTFEGKEFSTALIYTRSEHDYANSRRNGTLLRLDREYDLIKDTNVDKRFWYLADGSSSMYLVNHSLKISNMYINGNCSENFLDSYALRDTLFGSDILFRVTGLNQISIIDSSGDEFCNTENTWKFRDYNSIIKIIVEYAALEHGVVDALISDIIYCSQNSISSIIWLPKDDRKEKLNTVLAKNFRIFKHQIPITNPSNNGLVRRIISSDGVTIINHSGKIISHGSIVNLNKVASKGQVGTGESASKLLAENGVAIKISQDGNIKVFYSSGERSLIF